MSTNGILAASTIGAPEPVVGGPATLLLWTDRHACTVVKVERFKTGPSQGQVKAVWATQDIAKRVDGNGLSENQTWTFQTDPDAQPTRYSKRKNGRFEGPNGTLAIGYRSEFFDPHF